MPINFWVHFLNLSRWLCFPLLGYVLTCTTSTKDIKVISAEDVNFRLLQNPCIPDKCKFTHYNIFTYYGAKYSLVQNPQQTRVNIICTHIYLLQSLVIFRIFHWICRSHIYLHILNILLYKCRLCCYCTSTTMFWFIVMPLTQRQVDVPCIF
jgi:hypothetical protein